MVDIENGLDNFWLEVENFIRSKLNIKIIWKKKLIVNGVNEKC